MLVWGHRIYECFLLKDPTRPNESKWHRCRGWCHDTVIQPFRGYLWFPSQVWWIPFFTNFISFLFPFVKFTFIFFLTLIHNFSNSSLKTHHCQSIIFGSKILAWSCFYHFHQSPCTTSSMPLPFYKVFPKKLVFLFVEKRVGLRVMSSQF